MTTRAAQGDLSHAATTDAKGKLQSSATPRRASKSAAIGRVPGQPATSRIAPDIASIQQAIGNRATVQLLQRRDAEGTGVGDPGCGRRAHQPSTGLPAPVQARGLAGWRETLKAASSGETRSAAIHDQAAQGIHGQGRPLPHLRRLQAIFGAHELGGVRAHLGAEARGACEALGAEAYATGEHVAFADPRPSLRTVAHEVTHVLQQRAGVSIRGGLGRPGDAYERQADRVADVAGRGGSVEGELPRARPGSGTRRDPVQRLTTRTELIAEAGEPRAHGRFTRHSKLYHALLDRLREYESIAQLSIPSLSSSRYSRGFDRIDRSIGGVIAACDVFITKFGALTGWAAAGHGTEIARVPAIRSLRQEAQAEQAEIPGLGGERRYVGLTYKEALALDRARRSQDFARIGGMIRSLDDEDGSTLAEVRDAILELDDIEIKQALLRDGGLRSFIHTRLAPTDALIVASTLLERALFWWDGSGPDATTGFQIKKGGDFSLWILGDNENGPHKPDLRTGTMNCWEGVLFSMYVAGVVSYATLREIHVAAAREALAASEAAGVRLDENPELLRSKIIDKRFAYRITDTRETVEQWYEEKIRDSPEKKAAYRANLTRSEGFEAYYYRLAEALGAHGARTWSRGDPPPPAGDVVFFTGVSDDKIGEKWKIAHVCISLGRRTEKGTEIMNFGVASGGQTIWGNTTIEEALDHKYSQGYGVRYGPSSLLSRDRG